MLRSGIPEQHVAALLPRERIGPHLELHHLGRRPFAAFHVEGRVAAAVVGDAAELRSRQRIERPALGAVLAGCGRAVEWALALAAVEGAEMSARERGPYDALAVDVAAARRIARQRHFVDFSQ